jgi:alpha-tubulin suppressor-like RCC1 family protein
MNPHPTPTRVPGLTGATAISAGEAHTCALTTGGGLQCWGFNFYGQLGDGSTVNRHSPVAVTGLGSGVAAVTAGDVHTCALMAGGGAKCWGANSQGQLGDGQVCGATWCSLPVDVMGLSSGVAAIDAGAGHTCAVTGAAAAKCWGLNSNGQLGDGQVCDDVACLTPTDVFGLQADVESISAGYLHTCSVVRDEPVIGGETATSGIIAQDRLVKCWGSNANRELGDGTTASQRATPCSRVLGQYVHRGPGCAGS